MLALITMMAAQAETVAQVLFVEGQAYVEVNGEPTAAAKGAPVDRSATLITEEEAFVCLLLHNNRVVAFSDELELPVSKIAGLDGPQVEASVQSQLDALLSPEDRERLGSMVASVEKIGGYHARPNVRDEVQAESTLEAALVPFQAKGPQSKCVAKWAKKALPKGTDSIDIMIKTNDQKIVQAAFSSEGDPLPDCILSTLMGKSISGESVKVTL